MEVEDDRDPAELGANGGEREEVRKRMDVDRRRPSAGDGDCRQEEECEILKQVSPHSAPSDFEGQAFHRYPFHAVAERRPRFSAAYDRDDMTAPYEGLGLPSDARVPRVVCVCDHHDPLAHAAPHVTPG